MSNFKNEPIRIFLTKDEKHALCTCGNSKEFPMCDGAHRGTDKKPLKFTVPADGNFSICQCGKSEMLPFCDGSHTN